MPAVASNQIFGFGSAGLRNMRVSKVLKLICVAGARPNFIKIAPLMAELRRRPGIAPWLVHTGQHYDQRMSGLFFRQLGIPEPEVNLGVGSGSHATQTADIMTGFEQVMLEQKPDAVVVVGDVNSTIACGLVAVKLGAKLLHVEAGLRSFDRTMPEEINRIVTDSISDLLFCSEESGRRNLLREGHRAESIFLVGNVMIDSLQRHRQQAESSEILNALGLSSGGYALVTLHRPSNVDDPPTLRGILSALNRISQEMPVVFPMHPRTQARLQTPALGALVSGLQTTEPFGYLEFLKLMGSARVVLTDSGGIQEETTILRIPCLTLRDNTERPVTCEMGTNRLVGTAPDRIMAAYREAINGQSKHSQTPPLWDGRAAERIATIIQGRLVAET
jgi:UDP-N-acetylglucosamine 2-epimerase (non-hydrolysing)